MKNFQFVVIFLVELLIIFLVMEFLISPLIVIKEITEIISPEFLEVKKTVEVELFKYELFTDLLSVSLALVGMATIGMYLFFQRLVKDIADQYMKRTKILLNCKQTLALCVTATRSPENLREIKKILKGPTTGPPPDIPIWFENIINQTRSSLFTTRELDQKKDEQVICMLKNNLAYYLAIARIDGEQARKLIEDIYEKAKNYPQGWYRSKDTYVWVLWRFAKNQEERKKALKLFQELYAKVDQIPARDFKETLEEFKIFFDQHQIPPKV